MRPQTEEAYQLFHQGTSALAEIEANGMRVDVARLDRTIRETTDQMSVLAEQIRTSQVWGDWRKKYGSNANLESRDQLGDVLYNVLGYQSSAKTGTGKPKTDVEALSKIDHPFIKDYVRLAKLGKLHGTYLLGLKREVCGEYVHPFFHLHTVWSYRSSSSDPNFQNIPVRDGAMAELIRPCFIARPGHLIIENDFKGIEVCVAACYTRDPVLIDYIKDTSKDMHRDNAARVFMIDDPGYWKTPEGKAARTVAKSYFTFAGFYGSYYPDITENLWQHMEEASLVYGGLPMREHLARHGISEMGDCARSRDVKPRPGTYEELVHDYENWYWNVQYAGYTRWKKDWHNAYLQSGGFTGLTGFHYEGIFDRNQVLNAPIQGSAFHWLMWVLIRLQGWLKKNKMRSKIVGQIHDSIIGDVHADEKDEYLAKVKELVTQALPRYWEWICVPLSVEAEVTPVNGNWHQKKGIAF